MRMRLSVLVVVGALVVPVLGAANAGAAPAVPRLVAVRAGHHGDVDRVVFEFRGGLPAERSAAYVPRLVADPKGTPVRIAGRAILQVRLFQAAGHTESGVATAPTRVAFPLPNVMTAVQSGDFEAVLTYGLGLARRTHVRVTTLHRPPRVVVTVGAGFSTSYRKVFFFDRDRFAANQEPFFVPVLRPVGVHPAVGLLDRTFAGPTPAETAAGLRLLRSKARGFADLSISTSGIARVRLTGGCSSGGSTVTIAGELMPTLRRLRTVDFVKIYDPAGATSTPTGRSDSIPACLEP
jgi:hypothetical protein